MVRELIAGSTRFSELQKGVPLMSPSLLSSRLKLLTKAGVIKRNESKTGHVYKLTAAGEELRPVVELLGAWGHRWVRSDLNDSDLDAGLLMWDLRRSIDSSHFPDHRVVVQFEYPDAPKGRRDWWLISESGEVDLCLDDRGFEVDILIKCSLKVMTAIWICEKSLNEAIKNGAVVVIGPKKLVSRMQDWLRSSPLSRLGSLDNPPQLQW